MMFDPDDLITNAFDDFTEAAAPSVRPSGAGAVRAAVKHRRTVRATGLTALVLLFVITPVTAYALTAHGGQSPPSVSGASPSVSASVSPSTPPSTAPTVLPSGPVMGSGPAIPSGPDGRITVSQLTAVPVTIPKWSKGLVAGCPSGQVKLAKTSQTPGVLTVFKVAYANLDGDSSLETAAVVKCQYGEASQSEVIAFDRGADGHIVTLGKIVDGFIWGLGAAKSGGVTVDISDLMACCATPHAFEEHQQRTYAWDGHGFTQTGGPSTFYAHDKPLNITAAVTSTHWGPVHNNNRTGTVTIKITNHSGYRSNPIVVVGDTDGTVTHEQAVGAGASETVTITFVWEDITFVPSDYGLTVYEMGSGPLLPQNTPYGISVTYPLWK